MDFLSQKLLCLGWGSGQNVKACYALMLLIKSHHLVVQLIIYNEHAIVDKHETGHTNLF